MLDEDVPMTAARRRLVEEKMRAKPERIYKCDV